MEIEDRTEEAEGAGGVRYWLPVLGGTLHFAPEPIAPSSIEPTPARSIYKFYADATARPDGMRCLTMRHRQGEMAAAWEQIKVSKDSKARLAEMKAIVSNSVAEGLRAARQSTAPKVKA